MSIMMKNLLRRVMAPETGGEGSAGGGDYDALGSGDIDYDDVAGDRGDDVGDEADDEPPAEAEKAEEEGEGAEAEAEAEEEDDEKPDEKPKKAKKDNKLVPRDRLNQEIAKRKEERTKLEAENAKLRERLSRDETTQQLSGIEAEIETLETQYSKLSSEGQVDKAADLLKQIRGKERELLRLESSAMTDRARAAAKEEIKVETLIETLVEQNAVIDPDSDDYDQDVVDMIEGLRNRYVAAGHAPSAALKTAALKVLGRMAPQEEAPEVKKGLAGAPKDGEKRAAAVKKAVEADRRQPPKAEVGVDHDKRGPAYSPEKIARMSDAEYAKLPENVRAKARGDFV